MSKSQGKLIIYAVLTLVLFFGLIKLLLPGGRYFFPLELAGLALLVILSVVGMVNYHTSREDRWFMLVFLFYLLNLILIWVVYRQLYIVLLLVSLVGFVLSILPPKSGFAEPRKEIPKATAPARDEPHSVVYDQPIKSTAKTTTYSPGKYVASTRSNQVHVPTCDWAKKISKSHQKWFASLDEAWEKGYRSHSCLKG